jgi:uncharacterized protein (DUF58 family)
MNITSLSEQLQRLNVLTVECFIQIGWLSTQHHEGVRLSPYKGNGRDYCDFRDYQEGDKVSRINWKMLARRPERPVITLLEEERNACVCVLVDVSKGMDMVSVGLSKRELATVITKSIMRSATRTNDTAMFATYDERGVKRCFGRRGSHQLTTLAPAAVLERQQSGYVDQGTSGLACALRRLPSTRSLVFVVTDLHHFTDEDRATLRLMGSRHEIVFLSVSDLRERELPATRLVPFLPIPGFYPLVDDNGNASVVCTTKRARAAHRERFIDQESERFRQLAELNCKYAAMHTEDNHEKRRNQLTRILSGGRRRLDLKQEGAQ